MQPLIDDIIGAIPQLHEETRKRQRGRRPWSNAEILEALIYVLESGCPWRKLPSGMPSKSSIFRRLKSWREQGLFEQIYHYALEQAPEARQGYADATFIRGMNGGQEIGKTKCGKGSKLQVLCDKDSLPLGFSVWAANHAESSILLTTLECSSQWPRRLLLDKAYDSDTLMRTLEEDYGIMGYSPHRANRRKQPRSQKLACQYHQRWRIERLFSWLRHYRRIWQRWEQNVSNYVDWVCLAFALIILRKGYRGG